MAFLIRTVDFTAAGREIVRDRVVEQDVLSIGRAAENDIHLPDLAVEQHHVRLTRRPDDTLEVEAIGTLGFGLDGRSVTSGTIDARSGAEIELGSALLAVAREADRRITITIRQAASKEGKGDALRGFALASTLPSKRAMSWILAAAVLVLLLAVPVASHLARTPVKNDPESDMPGQVLMDAAWSSGELSSRHHKLEDNCEACHVTPFVSVQDETCLTCHEELGEHARPARLARGMAPLSPGDALQWRIAETLGKEGPLGCTSCHTEHEGPVRQKPAAQAFCADCHDALDTRLTDTALANAHDFGKEHPQFRPAFHPDFGSSRLVRASLDTRPVERSGLIFPHDVHMDPQGGAARMAISLRQYGAPLECKDCHALTDDKVSFREVEMEDACEGCHSLVAGRTAAGGFRSLRHGNVKHLAEDLARIDGGPRPALVAGRQRPGQFARGGTYAADFGRPVRSFIGLSNALMPGGICTECHLPARSSGKPGLVPVNLPDRFLTRGFFDHEAHKQEKCTSCHAADTSKAASDLLIPDLESCRDCHLGATATKTRKIVPSSCAMCHSYHVPAGPWSPDRPEAPGPAKTTLAALRGGAKP